MKKVYSDAREALDGLLVDGMTIAAGGFGLCGKQPEILKTIKIDKNNLTNLTIVKILKTI